MGCAPEIWTDCQALKTAYADAWATITGRKEYLLCFEALQRVKPNMTWIKKQSRGKATIKEDWTRDEMGNHLADRLAGACPMEVSKLTHGRAIHLKVTAREALLTLLFPHQWYFGDPVRGPVLTIEVETKDFTRVISALIPRHLARTREPERVWTSNFTHSLTFTLWTMLLETLRLTPVKHARIGCQCTMEAMAKGCTSYG